LSCPKSKAFHLYASQKWSRSRKYYAISCKHVEDDSSTEISYNTDWSTTPTNDTNAGFPFSREAKANLYCEMCQSDFVRTPTDQLRLATSVSKFSIFELDTSATQPESVAQPESSRRKTTLPRDLSYRPRCFGGPDLSSDLRRSTSKSRLARQRWKCYCR
jgi:hypothetical protein